MTPPLTRDQLRDRRVTVAGAARSGVAAARLLTKYGAQVFVTDSGAGAAGAADALAAAGIAAEWGGHTARALEADFVVVSPGVPDEAPPLAGAVTAGVPVYSELEVASWLCAGPIVAITGSNGKTTTTSLVAHIVRQSGRDMVVAGNIGQPLSDVVDEVTPETIVVLEVSSFQLDHVSTFRPAVAVLLNVTPDHLVRYDNDFEKYAASKYRIFESQGAGDVLVYNVDDAMVAGAVAALPDGGAQRLGISIERELERGAFVRWDSTATAGRIVLALTEPPRGRAAGDDTPIHEEELMATNDLALRGRHNLYNSLAAAIAARAVEIRSDVVRQSLASFEGVPHRLERVRTVGGVTFVNDSKATNVNAVWYALESFDAGVILIAGGRDKGNDYGPLKTLVEQKVKGVVAIGESAEKVLAELGPHAPHTARASSMEEAIQYARLMAESGDIVLLSPACASFDMFRDYEDRGDTFRDVVMGL